MPEYQSGSCNIGGAEVRRRKISGIIGAILSIAFLLFAFALHFPHLFRLLIFFPLVLAIVGWSQSRRKFCVVYGLSGAFNFENLGEISRVQDPVERSVDRAQALKMLARAALIAAVLALIFSFVAA